MSRRRDSRIGGKGNMPRPRARAVDTRGRMKVVAGVLGLCCASLVARAVDLQLLHNDFYQREGDARFLRDLPIAASRGMITDRNGEPLAVSSPVDSIWVNPRLLLEHERAHRQELAEDASAPAEDNAPAKKKKWKHVDCIGELAAALEIAPPVLRERLEGRADKEFIWLRRHVNPDQAEAILAVDVPGLSSQREFRRFYPLGEVAAHVLGFTNIDDKGQEGLELAYDEWLTGKQGTKRVIRDGEGRQVASVDLLQAAEPGRPLALSIDRRLQHLAHRALGKAMKDNAAETGSIVVLDVNTGEVLAMVNHPSYNPNSREGSTPQSRRNRAVTDVFEPGSTFKTFIVGAALETGKVTPDTPIETWPGTMQVAGHTVRDVRNFGTVSPTRLLTKSSNVGVVKLAMEMPSEHIHDVLRRFGFGELTGIGFPGEAGGVLPSPRNWGTLPKATISFGYGISVTALQLAQAYAVIGNGGRLVSPSFLKDPEPQARAVIDPDIAQDLLDMLETVIGPEGTARRAAISGYRVAGKSGTSRKAAGGGYDRRYVSLFAGLVPASNPRFAVVVVIDDPRSTDANGNQVYYGGAVAAPVFHDVMDGALRIMDVQPDDVQQWYVAAPRPALPPPAPGALPPEAESVPDLFEGTP
ncbi:penicillin-binding protein 2 [Denitratimonas sp. CY0512]|uniref:peptidoglycan D,D-transpeptidase FtsI family protein n=1 Tax=Denitratimonas sp. CY0512 TaxID=3131940 RepID=UPI0030B3DC0F